MRIGPVTTTLLRVGNELWIGLCFVPPDFDSHKEITYKIKGGLISKPYRSSLGFPKNSGVEKRVFIFFIVFQTGNFSRLIFQPNSSF